MKNQFNLTNHDVELLRKKWPKIIVSAWTSESLRKRLLTNTKEVFKENGLDFLNTLTVHVLENTGKTLNLVLPQKTPKIIADLYLHETRMFQDTSDSSHNQKIWQRIVTRAWEDEAFKKHLLSDSLNVLRENGIRCQKEIKIKENVDQTLNFILPEKPSETLLEEDLRSVSGGYDGDHN